LPGTLMLFIISPLNLLFGIYFLKAYQAELSPG
jgi:hypothetical protein